MVQDHIKTVGSAGKQVAKANASKQDKTVRKSKGTACADSVS